MAEASITVAVRVRPFSEKEAAQLAPQDGPMPFLGDGGLGISPAKPPPAPGATALRTRFLRPIIQTVDDKVLVFDPPDNNPLSRLYNNTHANYMSHGQKRTKDIRYAFDRVFNDQCGQREVFEGTTRPLLDGVLQGYNASVFAYGATGCGKTHTISGTVEHPGVIFLTMKDLYERIADSKDDSEVLVRLSYLEIYNETIRDLLSETPTPPGQGLMLVEDQANKISVVGISEHTPESPEHVLSMIQEGNQRRTMSPTEANAVSSRSHAVLQINVTKRPRTGDVVEETTSASLNIIDLAGSERASATSNNGARMKEGANINKSLLALGNCINALCQTGVKGRLHIPYRNSKLTRLLKFSLGGNCKTVMIVCVSPSSSHYDETHNTLKYANQAKNIRTKISQNLINVDRHVAQYVQTIHELREEVAKLKSHMSENGPVVSEAEKRKKKEAKSELDEVTSRLQSRAKDCKTTITKQAYHDGVLFAGEARMAIFRNRVVQLAALLRDVTPEEEAPADLTSERALLQSMLQQEEALKRTSQDGQRQLDNTLNLLYSLLANACRNGKLDVEGAEKVRLLGDSLKAQVEAEREKARAASIISEVQKEVQRSSALLRLACRSAVTMKDLAGELEYKANHEEAWAAVSATVKEYVDQLRSEAKQADATFEQQTGSQTGERIMPPGGPRRPMASRRAGRPSLNQTASGSMTSGVTVNKVDPTKTRPLRRPSLLAPAATVHRLVGSSPRRSVSGTHVSPSKARRRPSMLSAAPSKMSLPPNNRRTSLAPVQSRVASVSTHASNSVAASSSPPLPPLKRAVHFDISDSDSSPGSPLHTRKPIGQKSTPPQSPGGDSSEPGWVDADDRSLTDAGSSISTPLPPPPTTTTSTAPKPRAGRTSLFGNNSILPGPSRGSSRANLTALVEGDSDEDEEEDNGAAGGSTESTSKPIGPPTLTRQRSNFAAPTAASKAKASRVLPGEEGAYDNSNSGGNDENSHHSFGVLNTKLTGGSLRSRPAPYMMGTGRDSSVGPARGARGSHFPHSSSMSSFSTARRVSSGEMKPPVTSSRLSIAPGANSSGSGSTLLPGSGGSTSMFANGAASKMTGLPPGALSTLGSSNSGLAARSRLSFAPSSSSLGGSSFTLGRSRLSTAPGGG